MFNLHLFKIIFLLLLIPFAFAETTFFDNQNEVFVMDSPILGEITVESTGESGGARSRQTNVSTGEEILGKPFDIKFNLEKDFLISKENLVALMYFKNFKGEPVIVTLNFKLLNSSANLIHEEEDVVMIKTDTEVKKTFTNLKLNGGNYLLKTTASYEDITENFAENFAIKPLSIKEFATYLLDKKLMSVAIISLLIIGVVLYSFVFRKRKLRKERKN